MNLAYRMRPTSLNTFVGQEHLVGEGKIIRQMIESDQLFSMIFWGPPGTGKTTLAHIIAKATDSEFYMLSAVTTGKEDLMKIVNLARNNNLFTKRTILFIDEIHRWNKAQQDALLPHVESGLITLIGATTENPSFEVNNALLSRSRVFVLKRLTEKDLDALIIRALTDKESGLGKGKKEIEKEAKEQLIQLAGGDARIVLNALELAAQLTADQKITTDTIIEVFQNRSANLYDKKADEHYNTISAYIKSMRASNIDAALYYLARMVEGGEDPKFIARRMVIFASEDIGMAQPTALVVANEVFKACETIGYPECAINLAHGTVYLASAKKDRSSYEAYFKALEDVKKNPNEPIPLKILNAPTDLMKDLGYGKGYEKYTTEDLLPDKFKGKKYYK
jgi:putative ATPase